MNLFDKIFFPVMQRAVSFYNKRVVQSGSSRLLGEAGKDDLLHRDFIPGNVRINQGIRNRRPRVVARGRELYLNNPYAGTVKYSRRKHIVGPDGFKLESKAEDRNGKLDPRAIEIIEKHFAIWCRKQYCTMTKRFTFRELLWQVVDRLGDTGEYLLRVVDKLPTRENPYGISLEIIDTEEIDFSYNAELEGGSVVCMGVQFNQWKAIEGVYLKRKTLLYNRYSKREFLSASEIIYDFNVEMTDQARGLPRILGAIISLHDVHRWDKAVLNNATYTARRFGVMKKVDPDAPEFNGSKSSSLQSDNLDDTTTLDNDVSPSYGKYATFETVDGTIEQLPAGYDYIDHDPKFPQESHESFLKTALRKIAGWFSTSYNLLFGDLEGTSFSSLREGKLESSDSHKMDQAFLADSLLVTFYELWLKSALMTGALEPYLPAQFDRLVHHNWRARGWKWVRPLEQAKANIIGVQRGWTNDYAIAAELGNDLEENLIQQKKADELKKKYQNDNSEYKEDDDDKVIEDENNKEDENGSRSITRRAS